MRNRILGIALAMLVVPFTTSLAGAKLEIDRATLNRVLDAIVVSQVEIPVTAERTLTVELHDLRITGLSPGGGKGAAGHILTTVRVVAPEVGLNVPLEPRIALQVGQYGGLDVVELRFEDAAIQLPFVGAVDLAPLVPTMRYPAQNAWSLAGIDGDIEVVSRLIDIEMTSETIRFEFLVDVPSPAGADR